LDAGFKAPKVARNLGFVVKAARITATATNVFDDLRRISAKARRPWQILLGGDQRRPL
jgi:hypothetical protein